MVAHFDYYYNKGNGSQININGVLLIPRVGFGSFKMFNSVDDISGYRSSLAHTTICPAIASALSTVLGSYLISLRILMSITLNKNVPSMCGAGYNGASVDWEWTPAQCVYPNEVQIYGSTVYSSSIYDVGEACGKLAVFNFINHTQYSGTSFWLRSVAHETHYGTADNNGTANRTRVNVEYPIRPLIYIG